MDVGKSSRRTTGDRNNERNIRSIKISKGNSSKWVSNKSWENSVRDIRRTTVVIGTIKR